MYKRFLSQAAALPTRTSALPRVARILKVALDFRPYFILAAIKANIIPGLVRSLRELSQPHRVARYRGGLPDTSEVTDPLRPGLLCLYRLMQHEQETPKGLWKPAVDEGILPLLLDMFQDANEHTIVPLVGSSGLLLQVAPTHVTEQSTPGLVRAIARVLISPSPTAHEFAVGMLLEIGRKHPAVVKSWQSWGIEESLKRLTLHSDPALKDLAMQLEVMLFSATEEPDVSSDPSHALQSHPIFLHTMRHEGVEGDACS
jgi:hypothetical protein